jgi:hypothetical protein
MVTAISPWTQDVDAFLGEVPGGYSPGCAAADNDDGVDFGRAMICMARPSILDVAALDAAA